MTLLLCEGCSRHVRESELSCPFCSVTARRDHRSRPVAGAVLVVLGASMSGCGGGAPSPEHPVASSQPSASAPSEATLAPAASSSAPDGSRMAAAYGAPPAPTPVAPVAEAPAPRPVVEISPPKVTGKLVADRAIQVVTRAQAALEGCYQKALTNTPAAAGTAEFRIQVSPSGTVTRVETPSIGRLPPVATSCMTARLGLLEFPSGNAGAIAFSVRCEPSP